MIEWFEKAIDFSNTLNISITASWLILVVIGLRLVLKKAPKWVNVALWGIVALRLLMPFSIESSLSLVPSVETVSDQLLQAEPEYSHGEAQLDIITNPNYGSFVTMDLDDSMDSVQWSMVKMSLVWHAGIAAMSIYTLMSFIILRRKLRTAVILRDNLFQCETVSSPFVLGILKPKIYLPYGMDDQNLSHVIAHEQAHIRRKDHWWNPLGFLLLTIHWFNPLMWVAYILLCRDIELACDEKVIAEFGNEQRADYTQALVACAVNRRMIAACPLAFGEVGVKDRVKSIMNYRKPTFWIIVAALVVCAVVALCFLTDPINRVIPSSVDYNNAITIAENAAEILVIHCPPTEEVTDGSILIGRARGVELAAQLEKWKWSPCDAPRNSLPSPGSVEFVFSNDYRILVHQRKPGSLYQYAVMQSGDDTQYYKTGADDYSEAVDLVRPHGNVDSILRAKILEIHDGYFLVEPVEGSWELTCASQIEVPMKNMESSPEPEIGDMLLIEYDGQLAETYPARITNPLNISVLVEVQTSEIITAFEFNFAGNTSGGQKMELTEEKPYWCITVVNEGTNGINIDILGTIYMVDAGSTGHIYPDKAWDPGTYSVFIGTAGGIGMEGYAICSISSAPFQEEEPLAKKISSAERLSDHPLVAYISSEWAVDKKTENVELPFNHLLIKEDGSGSIDGVDVTWDICEKYTSREGLHIELWDDNEYVVSVVYWRDSQLLQIVDQNDNLLECYYHRIAYATG